MLSKGIWNESSEKKLLSDIELKVQQAVKKAEDTPAPKPEDIFKFIFDEMPENLKEQMKEMKGQ